MIIWRTWIICIYFAIFICFYLELGSILKQNFTTIHKTYCIPK